VLIRERCLLDDQLPERLCPLEADVGVGIGRAESSSVGAVRSADFVKGDRGTTVTTSVGCCDAAIGLTTSDAQGAADVEGMAELRPRQRRTKRAENAVRDQAPCVCGCGGFEGEERSIPTRS
jgi:hypothetical protein